MISRRQLTGNPGSGLCYKCRSKVLLCGSTPCKCGREETYHFGAHFCPLCARDKNLCANCIELALDAVSPEPSPETMSKFDVFVDAADGLTDREVMERFKRDLQSFLAGNDLTDQVNTHSPIADLLHIFCTWEIAKRIDAALGAEHIHISEG